MILTAKITEERKGGMVFTDNYLSLPWVIFSRVDSPFIGGLEDLRGKTVSVQEGFVIQELLDSEYPEILLRPVKGSNSTEKCLEMLADGGVDAFIGNLSVGSYIIMERGFGNVNVAAPTPFGTHDQAMAVRSDWEELAGIINKTLASLAPEEHSAIRNKWLSIRFEHGLRPMDIIKWILPVTGFFLLLFIFFYLWNRKLKGEIEARITAENKLQSSENRYKGLAEAAIEGILIVDGGKILDANKGAMSFPSAFRRRPFFLKGAAFTSWPLPIYPRGSGLPNRSGPSRGYFQSAAGASRSGTTGDTGISWKSI